MKMRYYEIITMGNRDVMEIMNEDFAVIKRIDVFRKMDGTWVYKQTELPAVDDDMIQVIKRSSVLESFMTTEPINDKYLRVTGYRELTPEQLDRFAKNATRK